MEGKQIGWAILLLIVSLVVGFAAGRLTQDRTQTICLSQQCEPKIITVRDCTNTHDIIQSSCSVDQCLQIVSDYKKLKAGVA